MCVQLSFDLVVQITFQFYMSQQGGERKLQEELK